MDETATGIIIRTNDTGEADRIVTLISRDAGLTKLYARAARKSSRRFGGVLEAWATVGVTFKSKSNGLHQLNEASLVNGRSGIRGDLLRIAEASHACELARLLSRENQPQRRLFDLLERFLDRVDAEGAGFGRTLMMELYFLSAAGYQPHVEECGECGKQSGAGARFFFSPDEGCLKCFEHKGYRDIQVGLKELELLKGELKAGVGRKELETLEQILGFFMENIFGHPPKTRSFWREIRNG